MKNLFLIKRKKRHHRIRNKIVGTSSCPRLNVFKSNKHFYAQLIDDEKQITLVSSSTLKLINLKLDTKSNLSLIKNVGLDVAKVAMEKKISKIVFDRGGYLYHGKVKIFADAVREAGLKF